MMTVRDEQHYACFFQIAPIQLQSDNEINARFRAEKHASYNA
jgi:hypothetical protein